MKINIQDLFSNLMQQFAAEADNFAIFLNIHPPKLCLVRLHVNKIICLNFIRIGKVCSRAVYYTEQSNTCSRTNHPELRSLNTWLCILSFLKPELPLSGYCFPCLVYQAVLLPLFPSFHNLHQESTPFKCENCWTPEGLHI